MRIIAGQFRGRRIFAPKGESTRPTLERTREALFNILSHRADIELEGARIIDLFAGSGALGLEAMSRGAAYCLFVEHAVPPRAAIRENIEALSLYGHTRIHRRSATSLGKRPASVGPAFTLAFLDPPYHKNLAAKALQSLHQGGWLEAGAHAIIEHAKDETLDKVEAFEPVDQRLYGDSRITIYAYRAGASI